MSKSANFKSTYTKFLIKIRELRCLLIQMPLLRSGLWVIIFNIEFLQSGLLIRNRVGYSWLLLKINNSTFLKNTLLCLWYVLSWGFLQTTVPNLSSKCLFPWRSIFCCLFSQMWSSTLKWVFPFSNR